MNKRQTKKQLKKLAELFQTVDGKGQLMPSFLLTPYSDLATRLGWCERFVCDVSDDDTVRLVGWQRLTPKGRAVQRRMQAL